ncbi:hypothetical protein [Stenotrophomonas sp.]|uniref:hypothetical protein n=1 Tax=Stenotrophomonas sp. TaxID=69392 RepID=UPI0028AEA266|nr:hypothetical protein [Stenotrophomonas sp.]
MSSAPFHRRIALATCVVLAAAPLSAAMAQQPPRGAGGEPRAAMRAEMMDRGGRGDDRSLSDAVRRVQRSTGGHILGAERVPFDGRDINRVKYMDDRGRVRYMDDPAPARSQPRTPRSDMSSLRGDNP